MTRQTSIACYHQIKREGLLSERRLQVLEAMVANAPCTASELEKYMNNVFHIRGGWKQLSILREQGVVYEKGTTICTITGRNVIEWDMTGNLPIVIPRKNKRPANLNKCLDYILKGMEQRGWDTISVTKLKSLKINVKTEKTT